MEKEENKAGKKKKEEGRAKKWEEKEGERIIFIRHRYMKRLVALSARLFSLLYEYNEYIGNKPTHYLLSSLLVPAPLRCVHLP